MMIYVSRLLFSLVSCACAFDLLGVVEPRPYVRLEVLQDGTRALQTSWRRFDPATGSDQPVVWLIGVAHLGEKSYYEQTQLKLDGFELVLFEGIGFDANASKRSSSVSRLQTTLADSLGLVFQLDAIRYDRRSFRNSDLGVSELQAKLSGSGSSGKKGKKAADPEVQAFVKMIEGESFALTLFQGILKMFQGNPQFRAMARLVIIETISATKGDVSKLAGAASPGMQRLFKTLIDDRNAVVLRDLREVMQEKDPPSTIAVFYGAGHMTDLEVRLIKQFGYRPADQTWVTAFAVNPAKAGLSAWETNLVQRLVRAQLDKMSSSRSPKK